MKYPKTLKELLKNYGDETFKFSAYRSSDFIYEGHGLIIYVDGCGKNLYFHTKFYPEMTLKELEQETFICNWTKDDGSNMTSRWQV